MKKNNPIPQPSNTSNEASLRLGRLILQLRKLESAPRVFGAAGALTPSEIHTIDAIGCDGGVLMRELADRLGVTKGAVTQIIDRLQEKKLVKRSPHPHVPKGILLSLTDIGMDAYRAHEEMHLAFYNKLRAAFTEEEIAIFEKCVTKFSEILNE
ncbi:MarR family transcriptional regulator [Paenibacillus sp. P96]|uniref:MarR family transcriptional regulator n=1 Tax=Paenibacillus zeirhizosphaerae TaxID=2987519 RepID=A0ABT9FTA4_9BACL|nr:MarR family transcriptional regulator [Paenibacillus sp. P96]MDP4097850.1 MarR family transcriptional regulator [Paenibacillus sp. P96]